MPYKGGGDKLGVLAHGCNPSIQEVEAGESQVWGQPELHRESLSNIK
jgi:hypothetical protein